MASWAKPISVLKKPRHAPKDIGAGISVYMSDSVVTYTVSDATPGYLSRQGVLDEIDGACHVVRGVRGEV